MELRRGGDASCWPIPTGGGARPRPSSCGPAGHRGGEEGAMREIPEAARQGIDILVSEAQLEDGSAVAYAAYLRRDARTVSLPILIATYDREQVAVAAR